MFGSMRVFFGAAMAAGLALTAAAGADDCTCQSGHGIGHGGTVYTRETNHGLLHYPSGTYWHSWRAPTVWTNEYANPAEPGAWAAPSPWAYHSIAPYPHHYHFFYGESYGWDDECFSCRN
jgi:hypothetical protein